MATCTCPICQEKHFAERYVEGQTAHCKHCKKPFRVTLSPETYAGPHPQEPDDGRRIEQFNGVHDLTGVIGLHMSGCPAGSQRVDLGSTQCECGMRNLMAWYLKLIPTALAIQ